MRFATLLPHSYTKGGRILRGLREGFGEGREGGLSIYGKPGLRLPNSGVSQSLMWGALFPKQCRKHLLRLFLFQKIALKGKKTSQQKVPCEAMFRFGCEGPFGGCLKTDSGNKNNFLRQKIASKICKVLSLGGLLE